MIQKLDLSLKGLQTAPNQLSGVTAGSLIIADNIVIPAKFLAESRKGQKQYNTPVAGSVNKLFNYNSSLILNYSNKMAWDQAANGGGAWRDFNGTFEAPGNGYKMRSLESLKNFYFTTTKGIYKLDRVPTDPSDTYLPSSAGLPKALDGSGVITGSSGFLATNSAVAYQIVWGYYDFNGNLLLSPPSQPIIVVNPQTTNGSRDVQLSFLSPIINKYTFYQVYRSAVTLTATDTPPTELRLVIQTNFSTTSSNLVTVVDSTPNDVGGATLYTSPSQEGIENSNLAPPFAYDMDVFKTCAFYANVKQKQNLSITIISVGTPSLGYIQTTGNVTNGSPLVTAIPSTANFHVGMRITDLLGNYFPVNSIVKSIDSASQVTISANSIVTATGAAFEYQDRFSIALFDFWAGSNTDNDAFVVDLSGTPAQNIAATAKNLVNAINLLSLIPIYAYYFSGETDSPGQILFQEKSVGGSYYYATSNTGANFNPVLPEWNKLTGISLGVSPTITAPLVLITAGNGYTIGAPIYFKNTNSTPSLNGLTKVLFVTGANSFMVTGETTVAGTAGEFLLEQDLVRSSNDAKQHRVFVSKPSQVESVPIYRYFDIGSANFPIERVVALRDGIFFFKKDGIYRISGETFESFVVSLIDNTIILQAPESAVAFNNQIFCFTTQGVAAVSDSGARLVSVPIENVLLQLASEQYVNFNSATFGVAYESERLYMLFTVSEEADTYATQAFVYNSLTDSWTRWIMDRSCGIVNLALNKLFMGKSNSNQIMIERKNYTNADYADEDYKGTLSAITATTIKFTLNSPYFTSLPSSVLGFTLKQNNREKIIKAISVISPTEVILTVADSIGFNDSDFAYIFTPIYNRLRWTPIDCENPGVVKKFSECTFLFKDAAFEKIDAIFSTNISPSSFTVPVKNTSSNQAWGNFPWGTIDWGGELGGKSVLRTYIPRDKQLGSWINITLNTSQAFTKFSLEGISLMYNINGSRIK